ncbi:oocyte zinc finger protein XlCOF19-like, partial [Stegastes partitus]|uniref:Oocyte zinc finger protein XlCOF19-like n=1 Tax=Stegastes partitus TaxID=144197 RepID=A0A9Y4NNN9_9TELE
MKKHYSSHTDEKLFACKSCEKSFSEKAQLKIHMRTHTGEKPYVCNTCGKRFSGLSVYKIHTAIYHKDSPYSCGTCGKNFRHQDTLMRHMRTHTELPLHYVYQEEEAPADLLRNQEKNSGLHQKDPDHLQIKEEQEDPEP